MLHSGRSVDRAVGVDRRIARDRWRSRRADTSWACPSPTRVTTTLRSMPCGRCGFDFGNSPAAIRSVQSREHLQRALRVEPAEMCATMVLAGLSGLHAPDPGRSTRSKLPSIRRDRARRLVAELVAADAAVGLDAGEPLRSGSSSWLECRCRCDRCREIRSAPGTLSIEYQ